MIGSLGATALTLGLFLYLSHLQVSESSQLGRSLPGQVIANSRIIRLTIFLISNTLIATCAVFSVVSLFTRFFKRIVFSCILFFIADKLRRDNSYAIIQ